jgi:hypothetical protein
MKFLTAVLAACVAAVTAVALPTVDVTERSGNLTTRTTPNETGNNNGYYYSFWSSGGSMDVVYTNGNGGSYTVDWEGNGDFTSGKGWNPGSARYAYTPSYSLPNVSDPRAIIGPSPTARHGVSRTPMHISLYTAGSRTRWWSITSSRTTVSSILDHLML